MATFISKTGGTKCPWCNAFIDAATNALNENDAPSTNDITVCAYCNSLLKFMPRGKLALADRRTFEAAAEEIKLVEFLHGLKVVCREGTDDG